MSLVEHALQYVGRGWHVFPIEPRGKKPLTKHGFKDATTDPAIIEAWWHKNPWANIGIATGASGLVVLDCDGPAGVEQLARLAREHGGLPRTLAARTGRGLHIYLAGTGIKSTQSKGESLDTRGSTGYVVAPLSVHETGTVYAWIDASAPVAAAPEWVRTWANNRRSSEAAKRAPLKPTQQGSIAVPAFAVSARLAERSIAAQTAPTAYSKAEAARLRSALASLDAATDYLTWISYGAALHDLNWIVDGCDEGFEIWDEWSSTSAGTPDGRHTYPGTEELERKWLSFRSDYQSTKATVASIFAAAIANGWSYEANIASQTPPSTENINGHNSENVLFNFQAQAKPNNPLIELNEKYAVIGNLGGKCLVMSWTDSPLGENAKVPSFQTFKSFSERYANRYVQIAEDKQAPLGAHWLKWPLRRSFDGLALVPNEPDILLGNILNLWTGFAVAPAAGDWSLMRSHLRDVLAAGDRPAAEYIVKFAAWCVQNPGRRAEVALVFRGGKGSGKGTFAHALRRIFGAHGLHISNQKHLTGQFNAHLRNCLLLYADEAFWAGDKSGESSLKALITESVIMIEQKGVDAQQWINRLHVVMTANADWVVPASYDERRYAVFDVSDRRVGDEAYFAALHRQMHHGGLAAMLHDLLALPLGDWHPRQLLRTTALQKQKAHSLAPLHEWWEHVLQEGHLPLREGSDKVKRVSSAALFNMAFAFAPRERGINPNRLGRLMREFSAGVFHSMDGNMWSIYALDACRKIWENKYGKWEWLVELREWNVGIGPKEAERG